MTIQYRNTIRKTYNQIPKEEQRELWIKMQDGDTSARDELIHSCLPLVYDIAKKFHYNNKHVDLDDLIQHGNLALIKAVDNWNIKKSSISTVATYYIKNSLIDLIKDSKYNIRSKYDMTRQAAEDISKIKSCGSSEFEEIVSLTGLTKKRVRLLLSIMDGKRIDYSLMNNKLHNQENYENTAESNVDGCLAELIDLVKENIESTKDQEIFLTWIKYLNKNNKTRLVADRVKVSIAEVSESVKKTKATLKNIVKEIRNA